ncbi:MAG: hypothetical protein JO211_16645 [Acidobacteriaceae bacterium]|nr:hypothetical protein [Acidobacteriaceae bacterium]
MGSAKPRKTPILDQWVEIRITDGVVTTELFPPNAELRKKGEEMNPPPQLVYRRLNFPDGVPAEYDWTNPSETARRYGGIALQRMALDTWLALIQTELSRGDGHLSPTPGGNLPRPQDRGPCPCPDCTAERELLEQETNT